MSRSAQALHRLVKHTELLLAASPPLVPTSYSEAPKYAKTVAAHTLAAQVLAYVAEVIVDDTPAADAPPSGAWVVAYSDHSGAWITGSEIDARRIADGRAANLVRFVEWGGEVW